MSGCASSPLVRLRGLLGAETLEQQVPVDGQGVRVHAALRPWCRNAGLQTIVVQIDDDYGPRFARPLALWNETQPSNQARKQGTTGRTVAVKLVALERVFRRLLKFPRRCRRTRVL